MVKYHGLAHRHVVGPRFLMRPLLNGGTLAGLSSLASGTAMGFLERLSKFFSDTSSSPDEAYAEEVHAQPPGFPVVEPTLDAALATIQSSGATARAVEAFWDGDTEGWFVILSAACIIPLGDELDLDLGVFRHGGDIRLFNGKSPFWSEAASARSVGEAVAARLGIPFYFPSPLHPEDDCPRWRERYLGVPCGRCGIPLLQNERCPWRGVCYQCHLHAQREARTAGGGAG
jgi:hypothetical protein